jgi:pSer/pThr/pTyr-binding forkhead associated (FHA) protein
MSAAAVQSPLAQRPLSGSELQAVIAALRMARSAVYFRNVDTELCVVPLAPSVQVVVGRREECEIALPWDGAVSRVHCVLRPLGGDWTIEDDGLSRNGTYLNGERVTAARRLSEQDAILVGSTVLTFRAVELTRDGQTETSSFSPDQIPLTPAQRRVLACLCRPTVEGGQTRPASNREIAEELFLSVETVKSHMKALSRLFSVNHLPQNQRRYALIETARRLGLVGRV